ncbi:restriction endonuclease subunit S [Providencia manganoxydans]|uniref:restriction endonuclease subunit S n=1 Tax=Providencia manganoxydans TaxID=2923283 RepID=UPI0034E54C33
MNSVEWGEFKIGDLFEITHYGKQRSLDNLQRIGIPIYNVVMQSDSNNGVVFKVPKQKDNGFNLITGNSISAFTHLNKVYYQEEPFYSKQGSNIYTLKSDFLNKRNAKFITSAINSIIGKIEYGKNTASRLINYKIKLPINNNQIDFEFMESFIAELEAERIAELEAYLTAAGLKDYELTPQEQKALGEFKGHKFLWGNYNIKSLFGGATRGKRLKSADRLSGSLPFVTAGESNEGVSAFIGNNVTVFSANTTTIDMFGSAKYRNYEYGADDHVAVVHTENLSKHAAIFVTTAIHKSSYTGKFDYGRNFYAKDADELMISLPSKNNKPDYSLMATLISAIQKLVIKDVVLFSERKITAHKQVVQS